MATPLSAETKIGLTFSQIVSLIATVAIVIGFYYSLNLRIAQLEQKDNERGREIQSINANFERLQNENRQDHNKLNDKMDMLIMKLSKN